MVGPGVTPMGKPLIGALYNMKFKIVLEVKKGKKGECVRLEKEIIV